MLGVSWLTEVEDREHWTLYCSIMGDPTLDREGQKASRPSVLFLQQQWHLPPSNRRLLLAVHAEGGTIQSCG